MISLYSRYVASLYGAHIGDSIMAPYEIWRPGKVAEDLAKRGGLTFFNYIEPFPPRTREIEAGTPTDDSELKAGVGQSLLYNQVFNPRDLFHRLRGFIHGHDGQPRKSILTKGEAYGTGSTLAASLRARTYEESFLAFREGRIPLTPSNGSLMRNGAVALRHMDDLHELERVAAAQSAITHVAPEAIVSCIAHALMHAHLLDGYTPSVAWSMTYVRLGELLKDERKKLDKPLTAGYQEVLALGLSPTKPTEDEMWPVINGTVQQRFGGAIISLRIAVWATLAAENFRDGLTKIALLGGDTDTYGAIAGTLLGAHFGVEGLPQEWIDVIAGREVMFELATGLYRLVHEQGNVIAN